MTAAAPVPASARGALTAGVIAYALWGLLPLYLRMVSATGAGPLEIICHRAAWALPWAGLLVLGAGQGRHLLAVLRRPGTIGLLALSATAIACNWGLFVWAVSHGHTLEASLGYYINPLMNMAAGALFFRERLDSLAKTAIGLTVVGVGLQALALGHPPFIALGLALTFTAYGLIRKQSAAEAQTGLFIECLVLVIPAVGYILWLQATGSGHFLVAPGPTALLFLAGPATITPLALFVWSARRLPLSALGFIQFICPTLQFALGVEGGEPLTPMRIASFGLIWVGVAVFAHGAWRAGRRLQLRAA